VLLLDELAHTNAPGGRHTKRWQDTVELLEAGIDVWTTLNVQHLDSVNDLVQRITGVKVRETLPDHLLDQADAVEFVDLPPEELLRRLQEGRVYVPDQAALASRQFFRKGNLIALRELALRRTAEHVDAAVRDYRRDHSIEETWPVAERVLACIRPNPDSPRLVRGARRLATRLGAEWFVVWVESPGQPALSAEERRQLASAFALAEQLGAQTATITGPSVSEAVLRFARERNVSKLVLGKPAHPRWRDRIRGSLVDDLVRASGELDVFIIAGEPGEPVDAGRPRRSPRRGYVFAVAVVVAATLVSLPLAALLDNLNLVMIYLLGVVLVATRYGRGPSVLAAVGGVAVFDFFFVPPHLTFAVSDTQYVVTFAVMLVVGLLVSSLAARVRDVAEMALQREHRTQALYALSRELSGLRDPREVAGAAARHVSGLFGGEAAVLLATADGLAPAGEPVPAYVTSPNEKAVAQWSLDHGRAAGAETDTLPAAVALYEPIVGSRGPLGVLAVELPAAARPLSPEQRELVSVLARLVAAPLERARLATEAEQARVAAESERLRSTLLSSVSHDLRTPLAAITGAASALREEPPPAAPLVRELAATVLDEAERLNRLVRNLLDMTRLESGTLQPKREWHSLEEVVGSALARVERYAGEERLAARVDPGLPLVAIDAVLVEQALVNLLENAVRHGGRDGLIEVGAHREGGEAVVEVCDEGPGFPPEEAGRLFDKFHRAAGGPGAGLGLAIARAIVIAHGGSISARLRAPRGACFRFTLPLGEPPAAPPPEEGPP
jgi:two-component system sensor histidine kinase KdpD